MSGGARGTGRLPGQLAFLSAAEALKKTLGPATLMDGSRLNCVPPSNADQRLRSYCAASTFGC